MPRSGGSILRCLSRDGNLLPEVLPWLGGEERRFCKDSHAGMYWVLEQLDENFGLVPKLKRKGYDGIIFATNTEGTTYVVFRPDQITVTSSAEEEIMPPEPGESPIPPGTIRLFHYTDPKNFPAIREQGLLKSKARGDDLSGSGPSAGVWASTKAWKDGYYQVEFWVKPEEISHYADYPELRDYPGRPHEDPVKWAEEGEHHVIMWGDVPASRIVAMHEPWHHHARYLLKNWDSQFAKDPSWMTEEEALDLEAYGAKNEARALRYVQRLKGKTASGEDWGADPRAAEVVQVVPVAKALAIDRRHQEAMDLHSDEDLAEFYDLFHDPQAPEWKPPKEQKRLPFRGRGMTVASTDLERQQMRDSLLQEHNRIKEDTSRLFHVKEPERFQSEFVVQEKMLWALLKRIVEFDDPYDASKVASRLRKARQKAKEGDLENAAGFLDNALGYMHILIDDIPYKTAGWSYDGYFPDRHNDFFEEVENPHSERGEEAGIDIAKDASGKTADRFVDILWVKYADKVYSTVRLGNKTHDQIMEEYNIPFKGPEYDRVTRGIAEVDRKAQMVRFRKSGGGFTPNDVVEHVMSKYGLEGFEPRDEMDDPTYYIAASGKQATWGDAVDFSSDPKWHDVFYGTPTPEGLKRLSSFLHGNPNQWITLYHGTDAELPIMEEGLLPTSAGRAKSMGSTPGFVYLSVFPGMRSRLRKACLSWQARAGLCRHGDEEEATAGQGPACQQAQLGEHGGT